MHEDLSLLCRIDPGRGDQVPLLRQRAWRARCCRATGTASRHGKKIAGVCAGLAEEFGISATPVRLAFVLLTLIGGGVGLILYVILWVVMPYRDEPAPSATSRASRGESRRAAAPIAARSREREPHRLTRGAPLPAVAVARRLLTTATLAAVRHALAALLGVVQRSIRAHAMLGAGRARAGRGLGRSRLDRPAAGAGAAAPQARHRAGRGARQPPPARRRGRRRRGLRRRGRGARSGAVRARRAAAGPRRAAATSRRGRARLRYAALRRAGGRSTAARASPPGTRSTTRPRPSSCA